MLSRLILVMIASGGWLAVGLNATGSSDESSIREILRMQTEAWNHGDGAAWARAFTDDCDFVNIRGDILRGRGALGAQISAGLQARFKGSHLALSVRRLTLPSPDVALIETDYEITGAHGPIPGISPATDGILKTRMQYVAIRRDKHWYFVAAQNTAVLPPISQH